MPICSLVQHDSESDDLDGPDGPDGLDEQMSDDGDSFSDAEDAEDEEVINVDGKKRKGPRKRKACSGVFGCDDEDTRPEEKKRDHPLEVRFGLVLVNGWSL
jgi:hypothetical protein